MSGVSKSHVSRLSSAPRKLIQAMVSRRKQHEYELFLKELTGLRSGAGLSQQELANLLGVGQDYVSRCESGKRRVDVVELAKWCRACGSSLVAFAKRFNLGTDIEGEEQGVNEPA